MNGRTPEARVLEALDALGVSYERIEIDPAFADTAAFCERYGVPAERSANTILVAGKTTPRTYAVCVVLATTQLDVNRRVCEVLGVKRASFATAEEMKSLLDMEVGGVTPFALPKDLPLLVDDQVLVPEWVVLGGGGRNMKVRIPPESLVRAGARAVTGLGRARPTSP